MWMSICAKHSVGRVANRRINEAAKSVTNTGFRFTIKTSLHQKSKSRPVNTLLLHTPAVGDSGGSPFPLPLSGTMPMDFTIENSLCQDSPARLNMIGYQRNPTE